MEQKDLYLKAYIKISLNKKFKRKKCNLVATTIYHSDKSDFDCEV